MTHDGAVKKLIALGFEWAEQDGMTVTKPSERNLTFNPGCCHGWIEVSGEQGLTGEVRVRVDGWDGFSLRFPSLVDLVEHIAA